ncbi:hypothetical protein GCM10025868_42530 [Angustibacter aerolatus]|uniref:Uncharacterized protein n=1 Tax=Angustibacter aerolatus TaxID=1162965 RepID=A0ABQ6JLW4_9ACTN|nr:hypothetical protein GCM10025868_42530 [Angustibacter aerolatus]
MGFAGVMAGPLVRSSYRAGRLYVQAVQRRGGQVPAQAGAPGGGGAVPARQEAASLLGR